MKRLPYAIKDIVEMQFHTKEKAGKYSSFRVPKHREILTDVSGMGPKHPIQGIIEIDVTKARRYIRQHKDATGERLSFTAWVVKCIAQAVSENKQVQGYRRGNEIIIFDDVDVMFTVAQGGQSERIVGWSIIRKANEKTVRQITEGVRNAQAESGVYGTGDEEKARMDRIVALMRFIPNILKRPLMWSYQRDPFSRKLTQGTIEITSLSGALGAISGVSSLPMVSGPTSPLSIAISIISIKPGVVGDKIEPREYLPLGLMLDHDVVDGEGVARFGGRLAELLMQGYGLEDIMSQPTGAPA